MNPETEDKILEEAMEFLSREIGININDPKELILLRRAIDYAGTEKWTTNPLGKEQEAFRKMFTIRATSYFKRKQLHPFDDIEKIKDIENHEHRECLLLKVKYIPFLKLNP